MRAKRNGAGRRGQPSQKRLQRCLDELERLAEKMGRTDVHMLSCLFSIASLRVQNVDSPFDAEARALTIRDLKRALDAVSIPRGRRISGWWQLVPDDKNPAEPCQPWETELARRLMREWP